MKILLCPDKFKGSISAQNVCNALGDGLLKVDGSLQIEKHPMADGGDGSIDILKQKLKLKKIRFETVDPLGRIIESKYYHSDKIAFIELASASGLVLLSKEERNPKLTSSRGTGLMVRDALSRGFRKVYIFVGGSATNDGGTGFADAMGFKFLGKNGEPLEPVGGNLGSIFSIENNSPFSYDEIEIIVLCDVINPMLGPNGASFTYAAQKGATKYDIQHLEDGLKNYSEVLKHKLQMDLTDIPGMGAAGAIGASLVGLMNAKLENGFKLLSELTDLESAINNADLIITGEGKIDATSFQGKVVGNVLDICKANKIPCGLVGGMIEEGIGLDVDIKFKKSVVSYSKDFNEAMREPAKFLFEIGQEIARLL